MVKHEVCGSTGWSGLAGAPVRLAIGAALVCVLLACQGLIVRPGQAEPTASGARLSLHPGFTRLTVDVSEPVAVDAFLLEISDQVVVRLPDLTWDLPTRVDAALGAITGITAQAAGFGAWRLVIDVNRMVIVRRAVVEPAADGSGYRLIVELADPDLAPAEVVQPSIADLIAPANPFLPHGLNDRPVIVIDPGHGGRDPPAHPASRARWRRILC